MLGGLSTVGMIGCIRNRRSVSQLNVINRVPVTVPFSISSPTTQSSDLFRCRVGSTTPWAKIDSSSYFYSPGIIINASDSLQTLSAQAVRISTATNAFSDRAGIQFTRSNTMSFSVIFANFFDSTMGTGDGGSIVLGNGSISSTNNLPSASSPSSGGIAPTSGSGTNIAGAALNIYGGKGTGTGVGGNVTIQVSPAGSSGSTANAWATVITISPITQNVLITSSSATVVPFVIKAASSQSTNLTNWTDSSNVVQMSVSANGRDFILDSTNGTKWGTATTQKQAFWNSTPVVQPSSANQAAVTDTAGAVYTAAEQTMLANLKTLMNQIRGDLVTIGLIKGSA